MKQFRTDWIVREVAARAGFAIKDVRLIMATIKEVMFELLTQENEVHWSGLFSAQVKKNKAHRNYNPISKQWEDIPEKKIIRMKASIAMTRWLNGRYRNGERRLED